MKSAEEFVDTDLNYAIFTIGGDAALEAVKARDLEMWKQGMTDAVEFVRHSNRSHGQRWRIPHGIEALRDKTKSV